MHFINILGPKTSVPKLIIGDIQVQYANSLMNLDHWKRIKKHRDKQI
uniref:Uncharacterized protein n=1 Tax=Rhizophora mucronata TaxID=61149 RepID=A0A2P2PN97_RHIMU